MTIAGNPSADWWRGAAIYQIYPRSFADSNGDGIGDLAGIAGKLEYVASLGVDGIWLSPFFVSPMADFGYDVADYCGVDPIFGGLADFDALVEQAHALGLKVIIDQVYAHTSDQHPWFTDSRQSSVNPKADWYVWADPKPDGSPPNNWASVFGGPSWTWDARRCQYYMHNFLSQQPQLNLHNLAVQDALLDTARFWLDRGVDGFRLDAINFGMHNRALTDNPVAPDDGRPRRRPAAYQTYVHNQGQPEMPAFLTRLRKLLDQYDRRFSLAEIGGEDVEPVMQAYTAGQEHLHSAYSFRFLAAKRITPATVRDALQKWSGAADEGLPCWAFSNHDAPRWISRWAPAGHEAEFARMIMLLLIALRGNIVLWQGEELGMTQVDIPFERLRDPEAIANWPLTDGRDGARTPMPWRSDAPNCGFSLAEPWLPLGEDHSQLAVNLQDQDAGSLLNLTRRLIARRRSTSALRLGEITVLDAALDVLVLERTWDGQTLHCIFNFSDREMPNPDAAAASGKIVEAVNEATLYRLAPFGGIIVELG